MDLTVEVKKILFRNTESGYVVFKGLATVKKTDRNGKLKKVKVSETFKGCFLSIFENDTMEVFGEWKESPIYGKEFRVQTYHKILPQDQKGLEKMFCKSIPGIGPKKVHALLETLGVSAMSTIFNDENCLSKVPTLSRKDQRKIALFVSDNIGYESLLTFLRLHELDYTVAMKVYRKYQGDSVKKLMDNPYVLSLDEALTFHQADKIAIGIGFPKHGKERLYAAILDCLKADTQNNGNMYTYKSKIIKHINAYLDINSAQTENAYEEKEVSKMLDTLYKDDKIVYSHGEDNEPLIYLVGNMYIENKTAELLNNLLNAPAKNRYPKAEIEKALRWYEGKYALSLAKNQKKAVSAALSNKISIITGGPGTGKTQTISALIQCLQYLTPNADIHLCSPTGRASKRMTEMCGVPAATLHRLFRINEDLHTTYKGDFEGDILIIDESSMIDAYLFYRALLSLSSDIRIVIIGDNNQLPSVGPGMVLKDLIDARIIATTCLDQIFRQEKDSMIIDNAYKILSGRAIKEFEFSSSKTGDSYFFEAETPLEIQQIILKTIDRLIKGRKHKIEQIQVLSPVKDGTLGTESLNGQVQSMFGGVGNFVEYNDKQYYEGDKVIHIKNNYELNVFNGEVGIIKSIPGAGGKTLTVEYPDKDVDYELYDLEELDLAFSITIHKSQGSEYPVVIIPIHNCLQHGFSRTSLYTACTRAKSIVIFVGSKKSMDKAISTIKAFDRKTMLKSKICRLHDRKKEAY